jgi:hypothetical protein
MRAAKRRKNRNGGGRWVIAARKRFCVKMKIHPRNGVTAKRWAVKEGVMECRRWRRRHALTVDG